MDDKHIIDLLWARAESAIDELIRRFGARLYRTAMNILGSPRDAEECVNDSYLAVWNAIPPRRPDPLDGFVYRVGRNTALKRLRSDSALKRNSAMTCRWRSWLTPWHPAPWSRSWTNGCWARPSTPGLARWTRKAGRCSCGGTGSATA